MKNRQGQNLLPPRRKGSPVRTFLLAALLAAAAGAALPHIIVRPPPPPADRQSDVVFVFAGGESRVPTGFRAWKEGKAKELYILGARGGARIERILPGSKDIPADDHDRLHVEGWSENTLENAFSAKGVVSDRNFRNAILVTSDYHMPRAHFALRRLLPPEVEIHAIPVRSDWKDRNAFPRSLRLFFIEGWKYWVYRAFLSTA